MGNGTRSIVQSKMIYNNIAKSIHGHISPKEVERVQARFDCIYATLWSFSRRQNAECTDVRSYIKNHSIGRKRVFRYRSQEDVLVKAMPKYLAINRVQSIGNFKSIERADANIPLAKSKYRPAKTMDKRAELFKCVPNPPNQTRRQ